MTEFTFSGVSEIIGSFSINAVSSNPLAGELDLSLSSGKIKDPFVAFNISDWQLEFFTTNLNSTSIFVFSGEDTKVNVDISVPEPNSLFGLLSVSSLFLMNYRKLIMKKSTKSVENDLNRNKATVTREKQSLSKEKELEKV